MANLVLSEVFKSGENNAGPKSKNDVVSILKEEGFEHIVLYVKKKKHSFYDILRIVYSVQKSISMLDKNDLVVIQYPYKLKLYNYILDNFKKKSIKKGYKIIVLIHDIDFLRKSNLINNSIELTKISEINALNKADYIISHNTKMTDELKMSGCTSKIYDLEIFDYKYDGKLVDIQNYSHPSKVVIAGNLLKQKSGYIYKLIERESIHLNLYGPNYDDKYVSNKVKYFGSFHPDELIKNMEGDFGLVWDGDSDLECTGPFGEYTRFNNPHKASLYLAAGLPVIVWSKSAVASFVRTNEIGICVDSLYEMEKYLKSISKEDYLKMVENVRRIGMDIRKGNYLKRVINKILNDTLD